MVDDRWAESTEETVAGENWAAVAGEVGDIQVEEGSVGATLEENWAVVGEVGKM